MKLHGRIYGNSIERTNALPAYLDRYNSNDHTAASATNHRPTRLNNLFRNYS